MLIQNFKLFDAHFHIVDGRFALVHNDGYLPDAFTCEDYSNRMKKYTLCGGAIVSGSFQGFDQTYLVAALKALGPSFVGVTQLPATVSDTELLELDKAGIRALRFNLKRSGSAGFRYLDKMARRVYETDLPSTRAARPYEDKDFTVVLETLGADRAIDVFYDNAREFYQLKGDN